MNGVMRRPLLLAAAILLMTVLDGVAPSGQAADSGQDDSTGVRRIERAFQFAEPWQARCENVGGIVDCSVPILFRISVDTPEALGRIDAVVSVTMDYATSRSERRGSVPDSGRAGVTFFTGGSGFARMKPGAFRFVSPSTDVPTTTTLTWIATGLRAAGRTYTFQLDVAPIDGDGDGNSKVVGEKLAVVIELWSPGA
jgi:hypothetical protein